VKTYRVYLQDRDNAAEIKARDFDFKEDRLFFFDDHGRKIAVFNMNNIKGFREV
jgi:hypothetical protein